MMLKVVFLVLKICSLAHFLVFQGSAGEGLSPSPSTFPAVPPDVDVTPPPISSGTVFGNGAPVPASLPKGSAAAPPVGLSPPSSAPAPQNVSDETPPKFSPPSSAPAPQNVSDSTLPSSLPPSSAPAPQNVSDQAPPSFVPDTASVSPPPPSFPSPIIPALPPTATNGSSGPVEYPSPQPPAPLAPAPRLYPQPPPSPAIVEGSLPPKPDEHKAPEAPSPPITPVSSAPAPTRVPHNVLPTHSITPRASPPFILLVPVASPPSKLSGSSPTVSPAKPPASSSEPDSSHVPPPLSRFNWKGTDAAVAASPNVTSTRHSFNASSPRTSPKPPAPSRFHSPVPQPSSPLNRHYHKDVRIHAPPPSSSGSSVPPSHLPHPPPNINGSSSPLPVIPKMTPFHALPPPPPNQDCTSLTCSDPLTNAPPGSPCSCVLPIQVGLRLTVALYNFFPLVSEFASEISAGIFLGLSQVRIMGANAATDDLEKTIVLTDLVPLGDSFDRTTALRTYRRFWLKNVSITSSLFGDYEVLFIRYPGLPPPPPSAPSYGGTTGSNPYSGRNNAAAVKPLGVDVGRNHHRRALSGSVIAIIVLSAAFLVLFCCAIVWAVGLKQRKKLSEAESTSPVTLPSMNKTSGLSASISGSRPSSSYVSSLAAYTGSAKTFGSSEIEKATDSFSETRIIGEGGFGRVYSGVLEDGTEVAVKVLKRVDQQGSREFLAEVEMLSRLHHRNLVKLIGICTEDRARCLVYELVPNGCVESHLHGVDKETAPLDWGARLKIALGAARGLAYLHEDSSPRVIHRDFKSSNILLEHDYTPKVSDFGLARSALNEENKHISTRVMGTFGYVAPEYAMTGHLLVKSDVYSYGVVLLELLTSRKPVDMSQPPGQENLVSWARPLLTSNEGLESMIDPTLGPDFPFDSISKVAAIASMCVQPEVTNRPFMGEVVQALKLISTELDETTEMGSRSCSRENLSADMDAAGPSHVFSHSSLHLPGEVPYHSDVDVERGYSSSELLSSSARFAMHDSGSHLRNSASGSLSLSSSGKARRLWQKMRHLSGGTVSEHGSMFRLWHGSR